MKKGLLNIIGFILIFITVIMITPVKASSKSIDISLDCPTKAEPKDTITCNVYAKLSGSNSATISRIGITTDSPFISSKTKTDIQKGDNITNGKIGTISLKSSANGGTGRIMIDIDVSFKLGSMANDDDQAYIKVASSINTLNSIKIDGAILQNFNKNITAYSYTTSKEKVTITASKTSSKATITGTGTKTLKCGNNLEKIKVTAQNKKTKTYQINIKRNCSNNAYLKGITISQGTLTPEFKEDVYDYNLKLDKTVNTLTIKGIKDNNNQKITGEIENKKINYGTTKVSLVVKSETGATKTYNINITKEDTRSDSNTLSSLTLSDGNITFDPNQTDYETTVLYTTQKIDITATPENKTSKVVIKGNDNLVVGENIITITVISEKKQKKEYKIKVTRLKEGETLGNNANIKNIIIKNYKLPFEYDKTSYKLVLKNEDKLDITVIMDDSSATYQITGNENLKDGSIIKIITKSKDGTSKTYTIAITKSSQAIYYVISIVLILLIISIPLIVYLRTVKQKKENLDVNGYKIGKEDKNVYPERKIIKSKAKPNKKIMPNTNQNINNKPQVNKKSNITPQESQQEEDFDAGLQDYIPNESTNKCPACGRELLGTPNECPYCKTKIR